MNTQPHLIVRIKGTDARYVSSARLAAQIKGEMGKIIAQYMKWATKLEKEDTQQVLWDVLRPAYDESKELVPVKTGKLRRSAYITKFTLGKLRGVAIGYGKNGFPPYATYVHELTHYKHAPPTTAKFLQIPLERRLRTFRMRVAMKLKQAAGT